MSVLQYRLRIELVFVILMLIGLAACSKFENRIVQKSGSSVYERVMRSGRLRCAYVIYPPSCMKDPNTGKLSGISIDALNLVANKLGLTVDWSEEVGWGTMLEGLQTDRYDMVATAVWTNVSRAKVAAFSKALFYTPLYACVKAGDRRFTNSLDRINSSDIGIATIDGGIGQIVAEEDFPKAHVLSMTQMTICLRIY